MSAACSLLGLGSFRTSVPADKFRGGKRGQVTVVGVVGLSVARRVVSGKGVSAGKAVRAGHTPACAGPGRGQVPTQRRVSKARRHEAGGVRGEGGTPAPQAESLPGGCGWTTQREQ